MEARTYNRRREALINERAEFYLTLNRSYKETKEHAEGKVAHFEKEAEELYDTFKKKLTNRKETEWLYTLEAMIRGAKAYLQELA